MTGPKQQVAELDEIAYDELEREEPSADIEPLSHFGTDFDVHGLVRRLNDGVIPILDSQVTTGAAFAGFQRKLVWKPLQMERFVESLLLGLPVPGIFRGQQGDKKLLVLDGRQQLKTLQSFYANSLTRECDQRAKGEDLQDVDDEQRRALDNTFIHW